MQPRGPADSLTCGETWLPFGGLGSRAKVKRLEGGRRASAQAVTCTYAGCAVRCLSKLGLETIVLHPTQDVTLRLSQASRALASQGTYVHSLARMDAHVSGDSVSLCAG